MSSTPGSEHLVAGIWVFSDQHSLLSIPFNFKQCADFSKTQHRKTLRIYNYEQ